MKTQSKSRVTACPEMGMVFATVTATCNGEATQVLVDGMDSGLAVVGHASHVPELRVGDAVMVLSARQGAVIGFRLRAPGERPQQGFQVNADGSLSVQADAGICIRTPRAAIELRRDGRLCVDGEEIYAIADGLHRLQGARIELN